MPEYKQSSTDVSSSTSTNRSEVLSTMQVYVTAHAKLRWVQRSQEFSRTLESAWQNSEVCNLKRPCGFSEVRYDTQSETLLCARDGEIVTVLYAKHEPVDDSIESEALRCAGCSRHRKNQSSSCQYCGTLPVVEPQPMTEIFYRRGQ